MRVSRGGISTGHIGDGEVGGEVVGEILGAETPVGTLFFTAVRGFAEIDEARKYDELARNHGMDVPIQFQ